MARKKATPTPPQWQALLDNAHASGFSEARIRDLAYAALQTHFQDCALAHSIIFPEQDRDEKTAKAYDASPLQAFLQKALAPQPAAQTDAPAPKKRKADTPGSISFEENRAAMEQMLRDIAIAKANGEISAKDALKIEADIRVKLNDKFEVSSDSAAEYIIVQPTFNHICEHTRRECWLQTREYAMQHWNLVPAAENSKQNS